LFSVSGKSTCLENETHRHTDRQTDKQIDRQTDRQAERQRDRQTVRGVTTFVLSEWKEHMLGE